MKAKKANSLIKTVFILFLVIGILDILGSAGLATSIIASGLEETADFVFGDAKEGSLLVISSVMLGLVLGILLIFTGLKIKAEVSWARTLGIVLAILMLLSFPIGTILGIVILVLLFKPEVKALFKKTKPAAS